MFSCLVREGKLKFLVSYFLYLLKNNCIIMFYPLKFDCFFFFYMMAGLGSHFNLLALITELGLWVILSKTF